MYTCVTNDEANTRMVSGLSKYLEGELRFNKLFAVWVKMINKNHYAYLGGISVVDKIGKRDTVTYRIYYTNGASSYYMQVKKISNLMHDILQFDIKEVEQVPFKELEFFTSPSYRCLELFAAHFLFPILGIFEVQKEENIEKVIDEYVTKLESMELTYFNFDAEDQEQEILTYLNRPDDKITRVGSFQYQDNDILREINFLQFLSSGEYVYFVQQKNTMKVNNRDVSIFFHFVSKDLVASKASLLEYYFNNEESNYLKVRQLPTPQVFSDFFKMVRFIEDTRKMGEE